MRHMRQKTIRVRYMEQSCRLVEWAEFLELEWNWSPVSWCITVYQIPIV
jgi:hypothetical protein